MSILIKGMEMPKNCYECKFGLATFYRLYTQDSKSKANCYSCVLTGKQITSTKRNIHCPLVPVPPHERLIDADAEETIVHCNNEENAKIIATLLDMDADGHYLTYSSIFGEAEECTSE